MQRAIATIAAMLTLCAGIVVTALPAAADRDDHMMSHHPRCPRGSHWVPPHRDKHGRWVPGHCRKS